MVSSDLCFQIPTWFLWKRASSSSFKQILPLSCYLHVLVKNIFDELLKTFPIHQKDPPLKDIREKERNHQQHELCLPSEFTQSRTVQTCTKHQISDATHRWCCGTRHHMCSVPFSFFSLLLVSDSPFLTHLPPFYSATGVTQQLGHIAPTVVFSLHRLDAELRKSKRKMFKVY